MTTDYWDSQAASFDDEPDHGLREPLVRAAWRQLLLDHLPAPADVVDLGCGTGSLSVLLAECGFHVRGLDVSSAMVAAARAKAHDAGVAVEFRQGDAGAPSYDPGSCDVVLSRHVLWALPDPPAALAAWCRLLRPTGRLLLVEGQWFTGGGIAAADCRRLMLQHRTSVDLVGLPDSRLWGHEIEDERYLAVSLR